MIKQSDFDQTIVWWTCVLSNYLDFLIKQLLDQRTCWSSNRHVLIKQLFDQHIVWSTNLNCLIKQLFEQHIVWSNNLDSLIKQLFDQHMLWSNNLDLLIKQLFDQPGFLIKQSRLIDLAIVWSIYILIKPSIFCWSSNCLVNVFFDQTILVCWSNNCLINILFDQTI